MTLKQCRETVSYLFDLLRQRNVPQDVVDHLDKIVDFMKRREYVMATDEYLKLADSYQLEMMVTDNCGNVANYSEKLPKTKFK